MRRHHTPTTYVWACLLLLHFSPALAQSINECYFQLYHHIGPASSEFFACNNTNLKPGGAQLCCLFGSQCGEDSLCRQPIANSPGYNWFVGGCTDPNYADPVCRWDCSTLGSTWIKWESGLDKWQCCGNTTCEYSVPTSNETFAALPPSSFSAVPSYITSTSASTPTSTSTSTSTSTVSSVHQTSSLTGTSHPLESDATTSGKSAGLAAAPVIGIVCAIVFVLLATIIFALVCWRRQRKSRNRLQSSREAEKDQAGVIGYEDQHTSPTKQSEYTQYSMASPEFDLPELAAQKPAFEVPADEIQVVTELSSDVRER